MFRRHTIIWPGRRGRIGNRKAGSDAPISPTAREILTIRAFGTPLNALLPLRVPGWPQQFPKVASRYVVCGEILHRRSDFTMWPPFRSRIATQDRAFWNRDLISVKLYERVSITMAGPPIAVSDKDAISE